MVERADAFFDALHEIILSFFFKLAIFAPAMLNACLVGFGVGSVAAGLWGFEAGVICGVVTAFALEVPSVVTGWSMDTSRLSTYPLPAMYIICSWAVIWFGLRAGLLVDVIGTVTPVFAVMLPTVVSHRKRVRDEVQKEQDTRQKELEIERERTKQARAEARRAKAHGGAAAMPKPERLEYLRGAAKEEGFSPTDAAGVLGVTRQTIYADLREINQNWTEV